MAKRGSIKRRSVDQETMIALLYGGVRSKSSGAALHDQGDIRTDHQLIEAKYTGNVAADLKREEKGLAPKRSKLIRDLEKIAQEAWQENREPVICYREWAPELSISNKDGWVDLTIRLQNDDIYRDQKYNESSKVS